MRLSNQVRRLLSLIMAVAICMSVLPWTVLAADTATVAEWNYSEEPVGGLPAAATGGANTTGATLELINATYNKFSSKSISGKGWSTEGYWLLTLDTTGYENLTFSASLRSSKTGPANFKLQYQLPGTHQGSCDAVPIQQAGIRLVIPGLYGADQGHLILLTLLALRIINNTRNHTIKYPCYRPDTPCISPCTGNKTDCQVNCSNATPIDTAN